MTVGTSRGCSTEGQRSRPLGDPRSLRRGLAPFDAQNSAPEEQASVWTPVRTQRRPPGDFRALMPKAEQGSTRLRRKNTTRRRRRSRGGRLGLDLGRGCHGPPCILPQRGWYSEAGPWAVIRVRGAWEGGACDGVSALIRSGTQDLSPSPLCLPSPPRRWPSESQGRCLPRSPAPTQASQHPGLGPPASGTGRGKGLRLKPPRGGVWRQPEQIQTEGHSPRFLAYQTRTCTPCPGKSALSL